MVDAAQNLKIRRISSHSLFGIGSARALFTLSALRISHAWTPSHTNQSSLFRNTHRFMSNNEVEKAQAAAGDAGAPTIFDKLLSGAIPSDKVYEDDQVYAFRDVNPQAPVHMLVIPKVRDGLTQLSKARTDQKALLGHLMYVAGQLGQQECPNGFRLVVNDGVQGSQSVYHLHIHILGGRQMGWPPG